MMSEKDTSKFRWGFIPGAIIPPLFIVIYLLLNVEPSRGYFRFISEMVDQRVFPALLAVSAVANLLIFYYFIQKEKWKAGRGVIVATMIYALIMVGFKYF